MRWAGNNQVGEGSMTVVESKPNELVRFRMDFIEPFVSTADVDLNFKSSGDQTTVEWTMTGKNNFLAKAIGLVMSCDEMVGGQFEQGLASLKAVAEAQAKPAPVTPPTS
jgi:hypothetical protein